MARSCGPVERRLALSRQRHCMRIVRKCLSRCYSTQNVVHTLEQRGLLAAMTSRALIKHLDSPRSVYLGIDPSAPSLHVGNLVALIVLLHFQLHGHRPIALIGGATGAIGDPSGRSTERTALDTDALAHNVASISRQYSTLLEKGAQYAVTKSIGSAQQLSPLKVVDNAQWLGGMPLLDFLSGPGKRARVSAMLARESVKTRLESSSGISFTEFTYNLLQAYDFKHLHQAENCTVQLGGSDQYGNIMAGIDMIQKEASLAKKFETTAYGLTMPLLTTASGAKFGKSAGNAIWLDSALTSPVELYQFFLQTRDADLVRYLKTFTFLTLDEIDRISREHSNKPEARLGQRTLAGEVVDLVHAGSSRRATFASEVLFHTDPTRHASARDLIDALGPAAVARRPRETILGCSLQAILQDVHWLPSRKQIREAIRAGSLYLNGGQVTNSEQIITEADLWDAKALLVRSGKRTLVIVMH